MTIMGMTTTMTMTLMVGKTRWYWTWEEKELEISSSLRETPPPHPRSGAIGLQVFNHYYDYKPITFDIYHFPLILTLTQCLRRYFQKPSCQILSFHY